MIQNGKIIDFSKGILDYKINQYIISSSSIGCNFNLISKKSIEEETKKNIILNFIEKDNENNRIKVECILSNENGNKIPCYLEEEVNKNFILDSYIGSSQEKNLFLITQENKANNLLLSCIKEKEKGNKVIIIVVIVIIVIVVIFITVIVLIVNLRKKQVPQKIDIKDIKPEKKDDVVFYSHNNYIHNNDIRSTSNRSHSEKESSLNLKSRKNIKK